ncbi:hypothetical protein EMPG_16289 [Blastomyces silverae]|uniref:Uncharacterized protein n=1 Tax=Blastomyces silverae TaxID=2060906 RepID=A0A0H1BB64_9EURO|nr:hypothetical protein EMPG_16289 [Blastomyces silverae]
MQCRPGKSCINCRCAGSADEEKWRTGGELPRQQRAGVGGRGGRGTWPDFCGRDMEFSQCSDKQVEQTASRNGVRAAERKRREGSADGIRADSRCGIGECGGLLESEERRV